MIHGRSEWTPRGVPTGPPARGVAFGFLHHEGGSVRGVPADKAACLRSIEANVLTKGYSAIDYNLMVFADGDVWEGRGLDHEDGATFHHNADGVSVCAVGNYQTETATDALVRGIGTAFAHAIQTGWLRAAPGIQGHREVFPTACPGVNLFARMGDVRVAIDRALNQQTAPLPVGDDEVRQIVYSSKTGDTWFVTDGITRRPLGTGDAELLVTLDLVKVERDPATNHIRPKWLPDDALARIPLG